MKTLNKLELLACLALAFLLTYANDLNFQKVITSIGYGILPVIVLYIVSEFKGDPFRFYNENLSSRGITYEWRNITTACSMVAGGCAVCIIVWGHLTEGLPIHNGSAATLRTLYLAFVGLGILSGVSSFSTVLAFCLSFLIVIVIAIPNASEEFIQFSTFLFGLNLCVGILMQLIIWAFRGVWKVATKNGR